MREGFRAKTDRESLNLRIDRWLSRRLLPPLLARKCKPIIPRSGVEGSRENSFSLNVDREGEPWRLLEAVDGEGFRASEWDGAKFSNDVEIALPDVLGNDLKVRHYYGLDTIAYSGIRDLAFGRFTRYPYLRIHARRWARSVRQAFFNRKNLATPTRIEILKLLRDRDRRRPRNLGSPRELTFSSFSVMEWLYGDRWYGHTMSEPIQNDVELVLDALVDSGELRSLAPMDYQLNPAIVRTLEDHDRESTREEEHRKSRNRSFLLALGMLAIAAATLLLDHFAGWQIVTTMIQWIGGIGSQNVWPG